MKQSTVLSFFKKPAAATVASPTPKLISYKGPRCEGTSSLASAPMTSLNPTATLVTTLLLTEEFTNFKVCVSKQRISSPNVVFRDMLQMPPESCKNFMNLLKCC